MERYQAERNGAVLDIDTGLREWFDSYAEAISMANKLNDNDQIERDIDLALICLGEV